MKNSNLALGLNAVVLAVTNDQPRVLTVRTQGVDMISSTEPLHALPFGSFDVNQDRTLELCMRRSVFEQTDKELGYVEQLYTFADKGRDPRERLGGNRVVSIGYLTLAQEQHFDVSDNSSWGNCFDYFPWEDWRSGRPEVIEEIEVALFNWSQGVRELRERVEICFGLGDVGWDAYKVLERYELLYEAQMIPEFWIDIGKPIENQICERLGKPMAFDHRRILATGLSRVRGKLRYRPVVFELIPETFTLLQLQQVAEALTGLQLHKQNFRRQIEHSGLVEGTGMNNQNTRGRPAELFRFRKAVLRERRAPGMATLHGRHKAQ